MFTCLGLNGSGKSTIVNGICLGLAGKLNVLGRSMNLTYFIKDWCRQGKNVVIVDTLTERPRVFGGSTERRVG